MNVLLDTCVVSELRRQAPDEGVVRALRSLSDEQTWLSAVSMGEIFHGVERLPAGRRKEELREWAETLAERFRRRIVPVDLETSRIWGEMRAHAESIGRALPVMDAWIAATAIQHGMVIYTRNVGDFEATEARVVNPWSAA